MRLWTWQSPEVAHALSRGQEYRSQWERVAREGRPAYRAMTHEMAGVGLPDIDRPPVWLWCDEPDDETIADRAFHVMREDDIDRGMIVLTIEAPESLTLFTSYAGWCERLADPTSRRTLKPAPELGPTDLQACLPYLQPDWVRDCRPLPQEFTFNLDAEAAPAG